MPTNSPPLVSCAQEDQKPFATLKARAALAGHTSWLDGVGQGILARWGRSMYFGDIAAASARLDRVTGQKGGS